MTDYQNRPEGHFHRLYVIGSPQKTYQKSSHSTSSSSIEKFIQFEVHPMAEAEFFSFPAQHFYFPSKA
jgi:hypothetical protein